MALSDELGQVSHIFSDKVSARDVTHACMQATCAHRVSHIFSDKVNYASLIATNAARFRLAAGPEAKLYEFGLRRAQGPDGGVSAARYSYLGGFDATSNALAGHLCDIPLHGTMAHSFVQSFSSRTDLRTPELVGPPPQKAVVDFLPMVLRIRDDLGWSNTNEGELMAFISYAQARACMQSMRACMRLHACACACRQS